MIALEEVASNWDEASAGVDQAEDLGRRLGMEMFYAPIYTVRDATGMQDGIDVRDTTGTQDATEGQDASGVKDTTDVQEAAGAQDTSEVQEAAGVHDTAGIRRFAFAVLTKHPITRGENHHITRISTQDEEPVPRTMPGFPEVALGSMTPR